QAVQIEREAEDLKKQLEKIGGELEGRAPQEMERRNELTAALLKGKHRFWGNRIVAAVWELLTLLPGLNQFILSGISPAYQNIPLRKTAVFAQWAGSAVLAAGLLTGASGGLWALAGLLVMAVPIGYLFGFSHERARGEQT